jgi:hypothetical protein
VLAAWPFAKYLHVIFKLDPKLLYAMTFLVLVVLVYYLGDMRQQGMFYLYVLLLLLPIGAMLRGWDTLILVFAFVLQGQIESGITRLFFIYSHWIDRTPLSQIIP